MSSSSGCGRKILFAPLIALLLIGLGCTSSEDWQPLDLKDRTPLPEINAALRSKQDRILRFGFDLRAEPAQDARRYLPFLRYLERATGYRFELHFTPSQSSIVDDLGRGVVHFAAVGAGSFLLAREKYGAVPLVRGVNSQGNAEYQSLIIVPPGSPLQRVQDLRGRRLAFGSPTSTQGYFIPAIELAEQGIGLADLGGYFFTGSHRECANAAIAGRAEACGIQDTMGHELARSGLVRILVASRAFPSSGIAASRDIPPEVLAKVRRALLDFQPRGKDAAGLQDWEKTEMPLGFIEAQADDYQELHRQIRQLGLLGGNRETAR